MVCAGDGTSRLDTYEHACAPGSGLGVSAKHGVFVLGVRCGLDLHSIHDGALVRRIRECTEPATQHEDKGDGGDDFQDRRLVFSVEGLCVSAEGDSVLVVNALANYIEEVRVVDGSWVRFIGNDATGLCRPQFLDCNSDVIVVASSVPGYIHVLSWSDGTVRAVYGQSHENFHPTGVTLLSTGGQFLVIDPFVGLYVLNVDGSHVAGAHFIADPPALKDAHVRLAGVVEHAHGAVLAAYPQMYTFFTVDVHALKMTDAETPRTPRLRMAAHGALAALPDGRVVVRIPHKLTVYTVTTARDLRFVWIKCCVRSARCQRGGVMCQT